MKLKCCLVSISFLSSAILMASGAKKKYETLKNWKHLGGGLPWIFTEPKNCCRWFPIISGHGTKKLCSMVFEILGLVQPKLLFMPWGLYKRTNQTDACKLIQYLSAALTGTVLFSTTIFAPSATSAICLAADSMYFKSGARPWNVHECF